MLTGESVPVEVGPGDAVTGATRERRRAAVVRATPGRRGHPARADGPAGRRTRSRARRQVQRLADRVSAVFVPVVIALAVVTLVGWLAAGCPRRRGVHRRRRGADHRLPVRAGPGHPDRAAGRHRSRRPTRHPDQGTRGAGVHPAGRHDRAGQDRHGDHRQDDPGRAWSPRRRRTAPGAAPGRRARGRLRASRSLPRSPAARRRKLGRAAGAVDGFAERGGLGVQGVVDGHAVAGRPAGWLDWARACRPDADSPAAPTARRGATAAPPSPSAGTARRAACSSVADTVKPTSRPRPSRQFARLGLTPVLLTGDNETVARAVAARGRDRRTSSPRCCPPDKVAVIQRLQADGQGRRDGRRRRQRRRRPGPGRPGAGDGHRHRRRHRGRRPDTGPRRPARRRRRDPAVPARRCDHQGATCSGPSATTSPRSRWPRSACSTR